MTEGSWWKSSLYVSWVSFSFEAKVKGKKAFGSRRLAAEVPALQFAVVDTRDRA